MASMKNLVGLLTRIARIVAMVAAIVLAAGRALAAPPLFELMEQAIEPATGKRAESAVLLLRVGDDGRWEAASGRRGTLATNRRDELARTIKETTLALAQSFNPCDALATSQQKLTTPQGTLTWSLPCDPPPDAATQKLIDLALKLTSGQPGKNK